MVMIVRPESTTKRHGINLYASGVALLCFCSPAFAQSEAPAEQPAAQSAAAEAPQRESLGAGEIIVTASKRAESIDRKSVASGKSVSVGVDPGGRRIVKKKIRCKHK